MIYLKFLWSLLRHKWFVFVEACRLGIPWLGIIHDWSKFRPSEFVAYARRFFGDGGKNDFDVAWLHHQKRNKHHWQYWLLQYDRGEAWAYFEDGRGRRKIIENYLETGQDIVVYSDDESFIWHIVETLNRRPVAFPMPDRYRREMLADWRGAGRAYGSPDTEGWYRDHESNIWLHPETRDWIERELGIE